MFPLGTVLVPYGLISLHVFEERYRRLVADVLDGDRRFGVVLIERGSEVGGGDQRFSLGTVAEIVDAVQTDDGRWAIAAAGTVRLRVEEWLAEAPYPSAEVDLVPDSAAVATGDALDGAERQVRRALALLAELGEERARLGWERAADPAAAAWQLVALAPLEAMDRQQLLAVDEPSERVELLERLARERADMIALRLGQG